MMLYERDHIYDLYTKHIPITEMREFGFSSQGRQLLMLHQIHILNNLKMTALIFFVKLSSIVDTVAYIFFTNILAF